MPKSKHFESRAIPGASFDLRVVGRAVRHRVDLTLVEQRHKQRLLMNEFQAFALGPEGKPKPDADLTMEEKDKIARLDIESANNQEEVRLVIVRTLLDGFVLPGEEWADVKTTEDLLEFGPEDFAAEIFEEAENIWSLPLEKKVTSGSPISSQPPADGQKSDSTAEPVKQEPNMSCDIAA